MNVWTEKGREAVRQAAAKRRGIKKGPPTEEHRRKISEATRGVKKTLTGPNKSWFSKGFTPWNKGRFKPRPQKKERQKREYATCRSSVKYNEWASKVKERDGYKCVNCGSSEKLHVHHIISWDKDESKRFDVENGKTYCCLCHMRFHGRKRRGMPTWNKGKKFSAESIEKMRIAHKGQIAWNKGLKSEEPEERVCRKCNELKSIEFFTPMQKGKWHTHICKVCRNKLLKEKRISALE